MADLSDVSQALVSLCAAAAYPAGTAAPSIVAADVMVYGGWPLPSALDADLAAQKLHVSVFPLEPKDTTRYSAEAWEEISRSEETITAAVAGVTITLAGAPTTPAAVVLLVDGKDYAHQVQAGDTLASIAAALAALVAADRTATAAGAVITVPGARTLEARFSVAGVAARELRRQDRRFQISVWAPTPQLRDQLAAALDVALARSSRLPLPDGSVGRLHYRGDAQIDKLQKEGAWRRDLFYSVEYGTFETQAVSSIAVPQTRASSGPSFDAQGPQQIINS